MYYNKINDMLIKEREGVYAMRKRIFSAIVAAVMTVSCASGLIMTVFAESDMGTIVRLDPSEASPFNNGEFEGWGTSLCWWANRMGYSEELTRQASDAFFSEEGLGLDIARYNLGGGDDPTHNHITRSDSKVPGVWKNYEMTNGGKDVNITEYDITKDQNQLNIAKAALAANPDLYFEGFSNSPPYFMTETGCTGGGNPAGSDNLKADMYDDFGKFIADATKLFKDEGIEFKSYSPMNEPDTNYWGVNSEKQEGCHYNPGESQSKAIIETRKALDAAGLNNVLVAGMDETDINKSVANYPKLSEEAKTALGRIDTHTYGGSQRAQLKKVAVDAGKDLWMSEVDGGWDGFGLADRIITDLNGMQASAWVIWDIVDSHKDSDFTRPDGSKGEENTSLNITGSMWGVGMANHDTKTLELANKYYFFGQFTKYINPGDTIIASSDNTLAAYNKITGDIKIVALNSSSSDQKYTFDLGAFANVGDAVKEIRTNNLIGDNAERWKEITGEAFVSGKKLSAMLKAGTLTTYVIDGKTGAQNIYGSITGGSSMLDNGSQTQLGFETDAEMTSDVTWSVSDENIASITQDGKLTVKNIGIVTVYAKLTDDVVFSRIFYIPFKGEIKGIGKEIKKGLTAILSLDVNISGNVTWSVSDTNIAEITADGALTAKDTGTVTIYASIGGYTLGKSIKVTLYTMTGTASWSNASNRPSDNNDYTKAADGDLNTFFDGTSGGYVQYDYGSPFKINSVKLAARSGNGMPERTVGGRVQGSNDGIVWKDLYKITSAILAGQYTTVEAGALTDNKPYRYFRYINNDNMANIAEFLIDGEFLTDTSVVVNKFEADTKKLSYTYEVSPELDVYTKYFAVYDNDNQLRYISENKQSEEISGDFSGCAYRVYIWDNMKPMYTAEPYITDLEEFTDNFESDVNIFGAVSGSFTDNGNQIYASGLERFGNVFVPVKSKAAAVLKEPVTLTEKSRFRLAFNMFAGWENNGRENIFAIKDANGKELVALHMTGGGYNFNQIRIDGKNVLSAPTIAQSRSNPGTSKAGANGWNASGQPYVNNVGYNKAVEIIIDGTGKVSVSAAGGMEDTVVTGTIGNSVTLGSIEITGDYNSARERVVSYDNFDGDIITYASSLDK